MKPRRSHTGSPKLIPVTCREEAGCSSMPSAEKAKAWAGKPWPRQQPISCGAHRAGGHDHRGDDEQRVAEEIVDGEPERRDHQDERGELEPRRALRWRGSAIGGICLGHGSARFFAIART